MVFLLLFVGLPIAELMLLLQIGDYLGFLGTVALVLGTGIVGATLAKAQGIGVLRRMQTQAAGGQLPARELIDGVLILLAAALLITPGVLTDATGFCLLLPPCRALLRKRVGLWFRDRVTVAESFSTMGGQGFGAPGFHPGDDARNTAGAPRGKIIDIDADN